MAASLRDRISRSQADERVHRDPDSSHSRVAAPFPREEDQGESVRGRSKASRSSLDNREGGKEEESDTEEAVPCC